jgi:hypothetical protein
MALVEERADRPNRRVTARPVGNRRGNHARRRAWRERPEPAQLAFAERARTRP